MGLASSVRPLCYNRTFMPHFIFSLSLLNNCFYRNTNEKGKHPMEKEKFFSFGLFNYKNQYKKTGNFILKIFNALLIWASTVLVEIENSLAISL